MKYLCKFQLNILINSRVIAAQSLENFYPFILRQPCWWAKECPQLIFPYNITENSPTSLAHIEKGVKKFANNIKLKLGLKSIRNEQPIRKQYRDRINPRSNIEKDLTLSYQTERNHQTSRFISTGKRHQLYSTITTQNSPYVIQRSQDPRRFNTIWSTCQTKETVTMDQSIFDNNQLTRIGNHNIMNILTVTCYLRGFKKKTKINLQWQRNIARYSHRGGCMNYWLFYIWRLRVIIY